MKRLLTSCFGLGWLPMAPGTWGSLPPAIIFGVMCHFCASPAIISVAMVILMLAGSIICVRLAPAAIAATGKDDPGEVVADELAGQAVTFLFSPSLSLDSASAGQVWIVAAAGFVLFRIFDIAKPWPIRRFEKFPKGWGILADDLVAGVFAWIVLQICIKLFIAQ